MYILIALYFIFMHSGWASQCRQPRGLSGPSGGQGHAPHHQGTYIGPSGGQGHAPLHQGTYI